MADARKKMAEIMAGMPMDYNVRKAPVPADVSQTGEIRNSPDPWNSAADTLNAVGDLSFELTGIPSLVRGGNKIGSAKDPLEFASGAAEAAVGMLPAASASRVGAPLVGAMFKTAPRTVGTSLGLSAPQTAEAASKAKRKAVVQEQQQQTAVAAPDNGYAALQDAVRGDPELETLFTAWRGADQKSTANIQGVNRESADQIRSGERTKAEQLKTELLAKLDSKRKQNAPFRERYPGAAEAIGGTAAALATALPFANTVKGRMSRSMIENPAINRLAKELEKAFSDGTAPAKLAEMQDTLKRRVGKFDSHSEMADFGKNWGLSSMLAFEGSAVPEQVDVLAYAPGHPVRENAQKELTRGGYYQDRIPAAALSGLMTSGLGTKAGAIITPGGEPSMMPAARELIERGSDQSIQRLDGVTRYLKAVQDQKQALEPRAIQSAYTPEVPAPYIQAPRPLELQSMPGEAPLELRLPPETTAVPRQTGSQSRAGAPNPQSSSAPSASGQNVPPASGKNAPKRTEKLDNIWAGEYSANARDVIAQHLAGGGNLVKNARAKSGGLSVEGLASSIKGASGGKGPGKPMTGVRLDELRAALKDSGIDLAKITPAQFKKAIKNIDPRLFSVGAMVGAGAAGMSGNPREDMARIMAGG